MDELILEYDVLKDDMMRAGEASTKTKLALKKMGFPVDIVRRVGICMYEGEINMVIHAYGGKITVKIGFDKITIILADKGPGIPDIEKAMQEGWSTAGDVAINYGFGAGMGLPNMKKNSDSMVIDTEIGVGTTITMEVNMAM